MIDFSTLQGLTIPEGVVTQIADASGRVLWSAVKEVGTLILRPSADIYMNHADMPAGIPQIGYNKINEEVSDGPSTYISANQMMDAGTYESKFRLSITSEYPNKQLRITSVNVAGESYSNGLTSSINGRNDFALEINGVKTSVVTQIETKNGGTAFDILIPDAIGMINEYVAINKRLPDVNIIITSYSFVDTSSSKNSKIISGVSQVYVVLSYEA